MVSKLDFAGPGGFSIRERGDLSGTGGKGIFVDVRGDQTGTVNLALNSVSVSGFAYHGIHVSDAVSPMPAAAATVPSTLMASASTSAATAT